MMNTNIIFTIFSIIGIFYFIKNFSNIKKYFSIFFEIIGVVFILYSIDWLWKLIYYDLDLDNKKIIIDLLIFTRNLILGSVGAFLLNKLGYPIIPILSDYKNKKPEIKNYLSSSLVALSILLSITILLLILSSSPILKESNIGFGTLFDSFNRALIVSVGEEIYFRLFLQSLLTYWLIKEFKYADFISIIITSILWATIHSGLIESGGFKFIQIFLFGIVLGLLMRKKGLESCIAAHAIFNFIGYVFLGGFKIVP